MISDMGDYWHGVDTALSPAEQQDYDAMRATMFSSEEWAIRADVADAYRQSLLAYSLIQRAEHLMSDSPSDISSRSACVSAAKACAIYPLSIFFYDYGCILQRAGFLKQSLLAYAEFIVRSSNEELDPVGMVWLKNRNVEAALYHAKGKITEKHVSVERSVEDSALGESMCQTSVMETELLAKAGDPISQYNLGTRYSRGDEVEEDHRIAFDWFAKSANHGFAPSQYNLGCYYQDAFGTDADIRSAQLWFQKAADQDFGPAQHNLGLLHASAKEYEAAYYWFSKAESNGVDGASYNKDLAAARLKGRTALTKARAGDLVAEVVSAAKLDHIVKEIATEMPIVRELNLREIEDSYWWYCVWSVDEMLRLSNLSVAESHAWAAKTSELMPFVYASLSNARTETSDSDAFVEAFGRWKKRFSDASFCVDPLGEMISQGRLAEVDGLAFAAVTAGEAEPPIDKERLRLNHPYLVKIGEIAHNLMAISVYHLTTDFDLL